MPPGGVLDRLHRSEHVFVSRRGDWVKREVHEVSLLSLGIKREI
jgi:hypothetical protein